nr:transposase [Kofleriaceae bacterium]
MKHGGLRVGAGRKPATWRVDVAHRERPALDPAHPVHVVMRLGKRIGLRRQKFFHAVRRAMAPLLSRRDFRIVHISIQQTHLHLLVEADHRDALTLGMQAFAIRSARAINAVARSRGKVWAHRYHASQIRTPSYARHALAYVLNNWRHHQQASHSRHALDLYASGPAFTGWHGRVDPPPRWVLPLPVSPPQTSLLRTGWLWLGRIDPFEVPAALSP